MVRRAAVKVLRHWATPMHLSSESVAHVWSLLPGLSIGVMTFPLLVDTRRHNQTPHDIILIKPQHHTYGCKGKMCIRV
ncbi:hypothetical protein Ancab_018872 [Ancistrocladus abbreviatus]